MPGTFCWTRYLQGWGLLFTRFHAFTAGRASPKSGPSGGRFAAKPTSLATLQKLTQRSLGLFFVLFRLLTTIQPRQSIRGNSPTNFATRVAKDGYSEHGSRLKGRRLRRIRSYRLVGNTFGKPDACRTGAAMPRLQRLLQLSNGHFLLPHLLLPLHTKSPRQRREVPAVPRYGPGIKVEGELGNKRGC